MSKKKTKKTSKKTERRVKKRAAKLRARNQERDLLSIKQAADMAEVSTTSVYRWVEEGLVDSEILGGHHFVRHRSLTKHMARRRAEQRKP